jgi:hypothetical protein
VRTDSSPLLCQARNIIPVASQPKPLFAPVMSHTLFIVSSLMGHDAINSARPSALASKT